MVCAYHWAVDEGRLDEVSLLFLWQKLFELIELCWKINLFDKPDEQSQDRLAWARKGACLLFLRSFFAFWKARTANVFKVCEPVSSCKLPHRSELTYIRLKCYWPVRWWRWQRLILCIYRFVLSFCKVSLPVSGYSFVSHENIGAKCCWFYAFCVTLQCKSRNGVPCPILFCGRWCGSMSGLVACFYGLWRFIRLWTERGLMSPLSCFSMPRAAQRGGLYLWTPKIPKAPFGRI